MAELKTKETKASVTAFINGIVDDRRRADAKAILAMMRKATGEKPAMWGSSIVGFGRYRYKYASGREGDWFKAGFSPRKDSFTVYLSGGLQSHEDLLSRLGKFKSGVGCLYVKRLDDVDRTVLAALIARSSRGEIASEK